MAHIRLGIAAQFVVLLLLSNFAHADQLEEGEGAYMRGDYSTAIKILLPLADNGNMDAVYDLATLYFTRGSKGDLAESEKFYKIAAYHGVTKAQLRLGQMYHKGQGVERDLSEAFFWYGLAASEQAEAVHLRDIVAHQLSSDELNAVKRRVKDREALLINDDRTAANHGDTRALARLKRKAEGGSLGAQRGMASLYLDNEWTDNGLLKKDNREAIKWLLLAAEQGDQEAPSTLFDLYIYGVDMPKDYVEAYFWGKLYLAEGKHTASTVDQQLNIVAQSLSLEQRQAIENRVTEWLKAHPHSAR
jgi:TPR repeat protein